jgi:hypothetical protein
MAHDAASSKLRGVLFVTLILGFTFGLSGCRHKPLLAPLPPIQTPVELVDVPPLENPPMLEMPQVRLPPLPIAAAAARPKRERKKTVAKAAPAPVAPAPVQATAAEPSSETTAIGALTAGGEANPQKKQEAADLIASIERRLNAFSPQTTDERKAQISKVRNFWRDAQAALQSGDAEGAMTLATKAKLLLDDLER